MPMNEFRIQYIVKAKGFEIAAAEILYRNPAALEFSNPVFMLNHDLKALKAAGHFFTKTQFRTQCNVEPSTILNGLSQMLKVVTPGVVVELVERNQELVDENLIGRIVDGCSRLRKAGYLIAMDDVTPTELEVELIKYLNPDFIKVENRLALGMVKRIAPTKHLIAERVETEPHADLAIAMGVDELQGFWCDDYLAGQMQSKVGAFVC